MKIKQNFIYFYTVQKQLFIPIHRYEYNLRSKRIDFFETKRQNLKKINFNYILFPLSAKKIFKLSTKDYNSFHIIIIDGIYNFWSKYSNKTLLKAFYLKKYADKINLSSIIFFYKKRPILSQDIIYLYISPGFFVRKTIEILYISTGVVIDSKSFFNKYFFFIEKGSCIKIIEHYKSLGVEKKILNSICKIYQKAYSYVNYCKIKNEISVNFLDHTYLIQEERSECNISSFSFYGKSIINSLSIFQIGKEIHSYINGFSVLQTYIKYNSLIEHIFPYGKSVDIYKGIYDKLSNTSFNGKIIILKSAKKTTAKQYNKNILLNNPDNVNANPKLEIFSEDVKCYHGCTIGQLITKEIFYLRSRGLSKTESIRKLLFAFAKKSLLFIPNQILKKIISKKINKDVFFNRN